jgi:hypothetical protein
LTLIGILVEEINNSFQVPHYNRPDFNFAIAIYGTYQFIYGSTFIPNPGSSTVKGRGEKIWP